MTRAHADSGVMRARGREEREDEETGEAVPFAGSPLDRSVHALVARHTAPYHTAPDDARPLDDSRRGEGGIYAREYAVLLGLL